MTNESLHSAIDALAAARPDVAAVEQLTARTLEKRETPFDSLQLARGSLDLRLQKGIEVSLRYEVCGLCGAMLHLDSPLNASFNGFQNEYNVHGMPVHLAWHNNLQRRLLRLEETV